MKNNRPGSFRIAVLLFLVVISAAACGRFNVPMEDLEKALPPEPAKEMNEAIVKFVTAHYKLYFCLLELDRSLDTRGGPPDTESMEALLGYAREFTGAAEDSYAEIRSYSEKNAGKIKEMSAKASTLEKKDQTALSLFKAFVEPSFAEKYAGYVASIRAYLDAANRTYVFVKERYSDIILGLGDAAERRDRLEAELATARDGMNAAHAAVNQLLGPLAASKAEDMGILPKGAAGKKSGGGAH